MEKPVGEVLRRYHRKSNRFLRGTIVMLRRAGGTGARTGDRLIGGVAITGALALVLVGCTADQDQVADPSRVLQTVDTVLTTNGAVSAVSDTTISVAGDRSSSKTTQHEAADAAADLPLRITTQYTTDKRSGTDLSDLDGYSGRVEIDLTIENLTVRPKEISYDVAGSARTTPALVGAPFSIAASTVLPGVRPDRVVTQAVDGGAATDGVVSTNGDGDAIVQWGRLLAPPTSGASSTLHLVADVEDLSTPAFDVAAQPGLTTDLSTTGVMNGAFGSQTDSELALQRRTIDLIAQVNEVLARAGGTITEVRSNLETTSQTLGVRTAERLKDSSSSLASTMQSLSGQLASLNGDLGSTVQATQSTVLQQLQQTTSSLDALLGDTSATAPTPVLEGEVCKSVPKSDGARGSVYANLLRISSQLDGYAEASEQCKQQVSAQLAASVGPESPDDASCATAENEDSLTCALWKSSVPITKEIRELAGHGKELAENLSLKSSGAALEQSKVLNDQLAEIATRLEDVGNDKSGVADALTKLDALVTETERSVSPVQEGLASINQRARAARGVLGDAPDGPFFNTSVQSQNRALADRICRMVVFGKIDQADADQLRGYLTATPCPGAADGTTLRPGLGFDTPMDERLAEQASAWDALIAETDRQSTTGAGAAANALASSVGALRGGLEQVRAAVDADDGSVTGAVQDLRERVQKSTAAGADVNQQLVQVNVEMEKLKRDVQDQFQEASDESSERVKMLIDGQARKISASTDKSRESVLQAFDQSIAGLRTTAQEVTSDSKGTIDQQKGTLQQQGSELAASVSSQTAASLQRIDASTSASVRDVEGANTLLSGDLNRVMLDLGDRKVNGSGILGAMATSAAKSDSADYQLALASQNAAGYANVRAEDVGGILLQQQQFRASLDAADELPAFRYDVPKGATSTTLYAFRIGGAR